MHAANLLSKRRQQREEHQKHATPSTPTASTPTTGTATNKHQNSKQYLLVDHQSSSSSSMLAPGSASPLPGTHGKHNAPSSTHPSPTPPSQHPHPTTISGSTVEFAEQLRICQNPSASCMHHHNPKKNKKKNKPSKLVDNNPGSNTSTGVATTPTSYYHKEENFFNCAHVGLCIMILGVIIMTIAGFVSHLLGFGEPGVIIVTGGACFCAIGLFLLCFGNAWYIRRSKKKALLSFIEIGRASFDAVP